MTNSLSAEQREIIELLQNELLDLGEVDASALRAHNAAKRHELLTDYAQHLEHLANAVALSGLVGLETVCRCIITNFRALGDIEPAPVDALLAALLNWHMVLLDYIKAVGDTVEEPKAASSLLDWITADYWPVTLTDNAKAELRIGLSENELTEMEDTASFPREVTAEMTSLALPDDVRHELVEGMIIELPQQVDQFETSIGDYLATHAFVDLNQAQRMAHTLKGAANIVGVPGIANLMHFTEDLLELGVKHWDEAPDGFDDLLLNASDCLAGMGEHLCGLGDAPTESGEVMQDVLDWLHRLKSNDKPSSVESEIDSKILPHILARGPDTVERKSDTVEPKLENNGIETPKIASAQVDELIETDLSNLPHDCATSDPCEAIMGAETEEASDNLAEEERGSDDVIESLDEELEALMEEHEPAQEVLEPSEANAVEAVVAPLAQASPLPIANVSAPPPLLSEAIGSDIPLANIAALEEESFIDIEGLDALIALESAPGDGDENAVAGLFDEVDLHNLQLESVSLADTVPVESDAKTIQSPPPNEALSKSPAGNERGVQTHSADGVGQEDLEEKHFINLPERTAHELLRIAGETQIANTQVNAQIESLQNSIQLTDRYHSKIRAMAADLDILVQTQSALRAATVKYGEDEIDPLEMERYSELHSFSHQLLELTTDSYEAVSQIEAQIGDLNNLAYVQGQLNRDSQNLLLEMRLIPVSMLSSRFNRCVRQASRMTHKVARLEIEGDKTLLDSRVLNRIADPVMHLLRNAVDHGLESTASVRREAGKDDAGLITLSFRHTGETVTIECKDDGRGLNYEAIQHAAIAKGLIDDGAAIDEAVLNQLIIMPGFSTRSSASQTSGRGIGLDAVVAEVRRLKGKLTVTSTPGVGSSFIITVPTSIISGHAVLVPVSGVGGQQIMGIVTRNIEQIVFVQRGELLFESDGLYYDFQGESLPVLEFNDLAGMHQAEEQKISALLITRSLEGKAIAVAVETLLASQELVIKPLNEFTVHPEGVVGATMLGDGTIAPVVDLQELPGMGLNQEEYQRLREQREKIAQLARDNVYESPIALIVDDSLSARRSLAQFVADIGMEVRTAKDGFEAISVLNDKKPAVMLVDLEMPRMNGLELTAHIRSREDTRDIPVIMITSRSADKHRIMAKNAGVNTYLNKPWSDEELLASIQQQIA
ncbi:hybrid sensor histidine kinase/response regulator [Teredinibacter purpureus]|uniref:hybrid sensor histidine kinase/response regulator n=1 Tax=Teredinibacter purpureus TaxID=2731756 RepID=UPI0005F86842|nr:hybrid sensor histidine kinase/response regulator [Teredinibacter purpureus]